MNKFTKLLSVFVIAGAVGAGVATLAGCGHKHTGVKHEAVAATCTTNGNVEYYTCSDAGCEGKYFSDEACTQEITDIVITAVGHHTEKFTDKGNGTHGITCEHGDLTETTEAHVDADQDGKCDKCKANVLVVGKYYNLAGYSSSQEIEIKADGKIVYYGEEYTLSAFSDDGKATFEVGGAEYTLTKTASGYKIGNTYYGKKPTEEIVTDPDAFIGTYTGELVYSDEYGTYKVTKFAITEDLNVLFTQIKTGDKDGNAEQGVTYNSATTVISSSNSELINNDFTTYYYHFIAQSLENDAVKTVNLIYEGAVSLFTKVSDETNEVVNELPLDNYTYYVDADNNYSLAAYESYATKIYEINGSNFRYKMEDADGNYIVTYTDSNFNDASLMLKISADKNSIEVYTEDGATKLTTLELSTIEYPTIKVDGTENNNAVVDPFNNYYAYYKIETAGWYKITAGDDAINIYTEVDFDSHSIGWSYVTIKAGKSKAIELAAGSYIAVSSNYKTNAFTAAYSENEPEPDYEALTNGICEIVDFDANDTYYVKGTVATAGKYYVTVDYTKVLTDMGAYFEIGSTKYGYAYDSSTWKWSQAAGGLVHEATLEANAEVKVKVGCDYQYASLGNVIVSLETEAEYTARLAVQTAAPTFSGEQLGNYQAGSDKYTVAADGISLNDDALTFVKQKNGVYYYASSTKTYAISFEADGSLSVTTGSSNTTANKPVEVTFTTEQQGTYTGTVDSGWFEDTYTFIIDEDSVTLEYYGAEILLCTGYDTATGVYTYQDSLGETITFKFDNDGNLEVTYGYSEFVAEKQTSGGDNAVTFTEDEQGVYVIDTITYTVTETGVTLTDNWGDTKLVYVSYSGGAYTFSNGDPYDMLYVTFGFVGGNMMIMSDDFNLTTGTATKQ